MSGAQLTLTTAGRAALVDPNNGGTVARDVTQIGIASAAFVPGAALAAVPNELKRLGAQDFSGEGVADDTIHVTIRDDSADQYQMFGFGLYLDNGVLLGTYSQATPITEKAPAALLLLAADVLFTTIDAGALTFGNANFTNPPATEIRQGVIEIATQAETDAGTDDARAVTPKKLAARIATREPAFAAGTAAQYRRGDKTWRDFFTDVRAATLTGLSTATNAVIVAADTVLGALGKLQKQITDLTTTVGTKMDASARGVANGVAPLGADSKVPSAYLPSFVDDVLEYATKSAFPATGEAGKIYVDLATNLTWRWGGTAYTEISASPGSTDAVAEGATRLYFTEARVRATVLTGLSLATNAAITATDTVLSALGKLQKQITDLIATVGTKAPLASPALTGTPTAPTPAQFDKDTSIATTEFVQRALGNMQGFGGSISANRTITAAEMGMVFIVSGSSIVTLPAANTVEKGSTVTLIGGDLAFGYSVTSASTIYAFSGFSGVTIACYGGSPVQLMSTGVAWLVLQGAERYRGDWISAFAQNGNQKLPSGKIEQWGVTGLKSAGSTNAISFPIAFPNACHAVFLTPTTGGGGVQQNSKATSLSKTGFAYINYSVAVEECFYYAIGN